MVFHREVKVTAYNAVELFVSHPVVYFPSPISSISLFRRPYWGLYIHFHKRTVTITGRMAGRYAIVLQNVFLLRKVSIMYAKKNEITGTNARRITPYTRLFFIVIHLYVIERMKGTILSAKKRKTCRL